MIRVFLIGVSAAARAALRSRLKPYGVNVVGEAADIQGLGVQLSDTRAEVLLNEVANGDAHRIIAELIEFDLAAEVPIVLLVEQTRAEVALAVRAGIRAVLPRDARTEQIAAAINAAATGLVTLMPEEVASVAQVRSAAPEVSEATEALTSREREVLQMLAAGLANKEIAARLSISDHTAKFHVAAILGKLGAATRTEAVTIGIRRGLVLL